MVSKKKTTSKIAISERTTRKEFFKMAIHMVQNMEKYEKIEYANLEQEIDDIKESN